MDGLPSEQKLNMTMRHYALPRCNYPPQELWEDVHAERCSSAAKCEAATHARIWLDTGNVKTNVFQENTTWISADSILKERSTLNIESKIGFANELGGTLIDVSVAHGPS